MTTGAAPHSPKGGQVSTVADRANSNGTASSQGELITVLNEHDVLCGRGSGPNDHQGNIKFRGLVATRKDEYLGTNNRQRKAQIAHDIVGEVRNAKPPGRFLKKLDSATARRHGFTRGADVYCVVNEDTALEKAKQALRQNRGDKVSESASSAKTNDNTVSASPGKPSARNGSPMRPVSAHSDVPGAYPGYSAKSPVASVTPPPHDYTDQGNYEPIQLQPPPVYSMGHNPVSSMNKMPYDRPNDNSSSSDHLSHQQNAVAHHPMGNRPHPRAQHYPGPNMGHQYMNSRHRLQSMPEDSPSHVSGLDFSISELSTEFHRLSASELPVEEADFSPFPGPHNYSRHQYQAGSHDHSPRRGKSAAHPNPYQYTATRYDGINGSMDPIPISEVSVEKSTTSLDLSNNTKMQFVMNTIGNQSASGPVLTSSLNSQETQETMGTIGSISGQYVRSQQPLNDTDKPSLLRQSSGSARSRRSGLARSSISDMSLSISDLDTDLSLSISSRDVISMPIKEEENQERNEEEVLEPRTVIEMKDNPDSLARLGRSSLSMLDALGDGADSRMSMNSSSDVSAISGGSMFFSSESEQS